MGYELEYAVMADDVTEIRDKEFVLITNCKRIKIIDCEMVEIHTSDNVVVDDCSAVRVRRSFIVEIRDCMTDPREPEPNNG